MKWARLTGTGTAAIATFAVWGRGVWPVFRTGFRPARGSLPDEPRLGLTGFGHFGSETADEVIYAVTCLDPLAIEIHGHGGRLIGQAMEEFFRHAGLSAATGDDWLREVGYAGPGERPWQELSRALTPRAAGEILQRIHGVDDSPISEHWLIPRSIALVGEPNVGKSSLLNALAGYDRSVVSPVPGTTRDLVSVLVAFAGLPCELVDTAGLRTTVDDIEQAGVDLARAQARDSHLVLWISDRPDAEPPTELQRVPRLLCVLNKVDLQGDAPLRTDRIPVSAATGQGLHLLIEAIVREFLV
jgi:tRNA modification GTPase